MAKKEKKKNSKLRLHPKSKHRDRYDLKTLSQACPELGNYIVKNDYGDESIDFFNPEAVKLLNKSLLLHFYGLDSWDIPEGYLCPAVPGRADYIHYVAEMLGRANFGNIPRGESINCLDIGAGANAIYPIIGIAG